MWHLLYITDLDEFLCLLDYFDCMSGECTGDCRGKTTKASTGNDNVEMSLFRNLFGLS